MSGLRPVVALVVREWRTLLGSPLAWAAGAAFLGLGGLTFFQRVVEFQDRIARYAALAELSGSDAVLARVDLDAVVIQGTARGLLLLLVFLVPLLAMRSFADDRARGIEEWLLTAPVGIARIVVGKAVGVGTVVLLAVAGSVVFPVVLARYGNPDPGGVIAAWGGLGLAAVALTGVALACSAWSRNQGMAAILAIALGLALFLLEAPARAAGERIGPWLHAVALPSRFEPLSRGLVEASDVAYFLAVGGAGLVLAAVALADRRWS